MLETLLPAVTWMVLTTHLNIAARREPSLQGKAAPRWPDVVPHSNAKAA